MQIQFFVKQGSDEISLTAVKLQKLITVLLILSVVFFVFNLIYAIVGDYAGFIWYPILYWILLACGFYGAYRRHSGFLMVYIVITIILMVIGIIYLIIYIIAVAAFAACTKTTCGDLYDDLSTIEAFLILSLIVALIELILEGWSCSLAMKLKRLINSQPVVVTTTTTTVATPYGQPTPGQPVYIQPGQPVYGQPPPGYAPQPVGYAPQPVGYAQPPMGYAQPPPTGYTAPPTGYAQPPMGYAQPPPTGYTAPPPQQ